LSRQKAAHRPFKPPGLSARVLEDHRFLGGSAGVGAAQDSLALNIDVARVSGAEAEGYEDADAVWGEGAGAARREADEAASGGEGPYMQLS
jgi:hypothetical protein